jgi:hypothetical protein
MDPDLLTDGRIETGGGPIKTGSFGPAGIFLGVKGCSNR